MSKLDIDVDEVKQLAELVDKHHLEELTVEHDGMCITVKGKSPQAPPPITVAHTPVHTQEPEASPDYEAEETAEIEPTAGLEGNIVDIVAPLVGVFYRAPAPDAPPCVEVGEIIEVGTEVGLIEAMKVFSPIPSEIAGEVVEVPGQNGKLVREGDVLVRVRVAEE